MKRSKLWIAAISVLILLVVVLMGVNTLRRTADIKLPPEANSGEGDGQDQNGALEKIQITPETVQKAIATLDHVDQYVRTITVERFWSGGSAAEESVVYVDGGCLRLDTTPKSGQTRHLLTDGEKTYIWYGTSREYFSGSSGDISADEEQSILTYEDVLSLDVNAIAVADYRMLGEDGCIYVETASDALGIVERYWVSLSSGLLVAAEKLQQGETSYRMMSLTVSESLPMTDDFTLPDGTIIHSVQ